MLDLVVEPDGTWRWKDEDELAETVEVGRFTREQAAAVRAEGERAVEAIEARGWPFGEGWEDWAPDPGWPLPQLPKETGRA